ncbi:conserved hypothetical protein [Talaromyces stipitatus ATCC 10500]|uniref:Rhodopsin domain-containing protein n=1 Tax=Talaromyces stipitatus (strain ATCC 10500 / CBS 375.48 / QM 6759 / NRRL 1006) TaxID=441959 RepID=B8MKP5_TALSN|nr:uncharacterized protein TSTA_043650 [Talaromyces stipitatus ATCC 10500]EED14894.1 conserved hypothetical protein [Talaromyces stipitatus ATCC 10500]
MADEASVGATLGLIWAFVAVSSLFMAARLYTRLKIVNTSGLDDYLMAFSLVCCYLFAILVTISIHWGMGRHDNTLTTEQERNALMYSTASFTPGILSFTVPKLGVTALLIRILNPTPRFTFFLWVFVGTIDLIIFGCVIILFAQCSPTRAVWTPEIHDLPGVRCWHPDVLANYSIGAGALSAFLDLFLALYPATVLYRLQMNRKKKIGLMVILGMGIFACAVSVYKATRLTGLEVLTDYTYPSASSYGQAACIPTITPLLESIFGNNVFRGRSAEQSSYDRKKAARNRHQQNNNNNGRSQSVPSAGAGTQRGRQGSSSHQNWMSSTLISSQSRDSMHNNIVAKQLSPTSPSSQSCHIKSVTVTSKTDVESQASILDYDDDRHIDDDDLEGEEQIPMSHISRHDSFTIQYETTDPSIRNEHNVIEGGTIGRNGRPLSIWRRSFSKYGYPGLSGYNHNNHHNHRPGS